jgi:hypothetical protein
MSRVTHISAGLNCRLSFFASKYSGRPCIYDVMAKLSLYLIKHYAMKMYGGVAVQFYAFLPSALDRSEWSVSHHGRFNPRKRAVGSHWMGGQASPKDGLGATQNRNISRTAGDQTPIPRPYSQQPSHANGEWLCVRFSK